MLPTSPERARNYWLIQQLQNLSTSAIPHAIHLHGHNFFVLGQGNSIWVGDLSLNFVNPTRRDTATIYGQVSLAIAFQSSNPVAGLLHCHIAWHINQGFGLQFLNTPEKMRLIDGGTSNEECDSWNRCYAGAYWKKADSGL